MEEKKNNKGFIWLIAILSVLVLGLVGYIVYDKVLSTDKELLKDDATTDNIKSEEKDEFKDKEENKKEKITKFETNMDNKTCFSVTKANYYDYENSYEVLIKGVNLKNKKVTFKYFHDYSTLKTKYYIDDKEVWSSDLNENLFVELCAYDGYLFATKSWEFMTGSTVIFNSEGKYVETISNNYEYSNGIITVLDITSLNDWSKGVIESYKFNLKEPELKGYDYTSEIFSCEDYGPEVDVDTDNKIESFKDAYCTV